MNSKLMFSNSYIRSCLCIPKILTINNSTYGAYQDDEYLISWNINNTVFVNNFQTYCIKINGRNINRELLLHWNQYKNYCYVSNFAPWTLSHEEKRMWYNNPNNKLSLDESDYKFRILNIFDIKPTYDKQIINKELDKYLLYDINNIIYQYT